MASLVPSNSAPARHDRVTVGVTCSPEGGSHAPH
jgi:hypothetical protein